MKKVLYLVLVLLMGAVVWSAPVVVGASNGGDNYIPSSTPPISNNSHTPSSSSFIPPTAEIPSSASSPTPPTTPTTPPPATTPATPPSATTPATPATAPTAPTTAKKTAAKPATEKPTATTKPAPGSESGGNVFFPGGQDALRKKLGLPGGIAAGPQSTENGTEKAQVYIKRVIVAISRFILSLLSTIAVLAFIYAGFLYVTAAGRTGNYDKAKNIMMYASLGLLVALFSYAIVTAIVQFPGSVSEEHAAGSGASTAPTPPTPAKPAAPADGGGSGAGVESAPAQLATSGNKNNERDQNKEKKKLAKKAKKIEANSSVAKNSDTKKPSTKNYCDLAEKQLEDDTQSWVAAQAKTFDMNFTDYMKRCGLLETYDKYQNQIVAGDEKICKTYLSTQDGGDGTLDALYQSTKACVFDNTQKPSTKNYCDLAEKQLEDDTQSWVAAQAKTFDMSFTDYMKKCNLFETYNEYQNKIAEDNQRVCKTYLSTQDGGDGTLDALYQSAKACVF